MQSEATIERRTRAVQFATLTLVFVLAVVPQSVAQPPVEKDWIGKRVGQKQRDFKIQVGNEQIQRTVAIDIWRVEKVDGPRVCLTAESFGITGWAASDQIVSIEKAVDYFSLQLRKQLRDGFSYPSMPQPITTALEPSWKRGIMTRPWSI